MLIDKLGAFSHSICPMFSSDLSISAAARKYGISRRTIHRWIKAGKLHPLGGKVMDSEIESVIREQKEDAEYRPGRRLGARWIKTTPKLFRLRRDRMANARANSHLVPRVAQYLVALTDEKFCWFMGQFAREAKRRGVKPHPYMVSYVNSTPPASETTK